MFSRSFRSLFRALAGHAPRSRRNQSTTDRRDVPAQIDLLESRQFLSATAATTTTTAVTANATGATDAGRGVFHPAATPIFSMAAYQFNLVENSPSGTVVGSVSATDPDLGDTVSYTIDAGNTDNAFGIDAVTGQITVANPSAIDFETNPVFVLTVTATDDSVLAESASVPVTIQLIDANDAPIILPQTFDVNENSPPGTFVGQVVATDPDVGQPLTYAITSGNTVNAFAINPSTGRLTVANLPPNILNSFFLTVKVTDSAGAASSATVTVTINRVNLPPIVSPATFSVSEGATAGTFVGTVVATDPDAGQTVSFAIVGGNLGNAFAINSRTGQLTVKNPSALDYETNPGFALKIAATDNGAPPATGTGQIYIKLTNVNEAPVVTADTFAVKIGAAIGTVVGTVKASDPEGSAVSYSITAGNGTQNNAFAINSSTGVITVLSTSAVAAAKTYNLTVTVADASNPPLLGTGIITIVVNSTGKLNQPPVVVPSAFTIPENSAANTLVGTVIASDPDAGQTRTFAISSGNKGNAFAIDATSGRITVKTPSALDYEKTPVFRLVVKVTDNGVPPATGTGIITINLTDVVGAVVVPTKTSQAKTGSPASLPPEISETATHSVSKLKSTAKTILALLSGRR